MAKHRTKICPRCGGRRFQAGSRTVSALCAADVTQLDEADPDLGLKRWQSAPAAALRPGAKKSDHENLQVILAHHPGLAHLGASGRGPGDCVTTRPAQ